MGRTPVYTDSKGTLCMPYGTKLMQEKDGDAVNIPFFHLTLGKLPAMAVILGYGFR